MMNRIFLASACLFVAIGAVQAATSYGYENDDVSSYYGTDDKYAPSYYYAKEAPVNPLKKLATAIEEKVMKSKMEAELKKTEADMKKAADKYAKGFSKTKKEEEKKEYIPEEAYYEASAPAFTPAHMGGSIYCFKQYINPVYANPTFTCPKDYKVANDEYGNTACTKSSTSCLPGKAIYSNGKCCSTCPKGFTQKGMECCSEPKVVCKVQTKPCPADCKQKMMCEKEGDYAKGKCKFQCCKTEQQTFPIMCTEPQTFTSTVAADISCGKGIYDGKKGKCQLANGGWSACPAHYATCLCKKGEESFCVVPQLFSMFDTCELICQDKPRLARVMCPPTRASSNTYNPK